MQRKITFSGGRGCVFDDLKTHEKEILALVHSNVRSPNPAMSYLLSWKECKQSTKLQCEETIDICIEKIGINNQILNKKTHKKRGACTPIRRKIDTAPLPCELQYKIKLLFKIALFFSLTHRVF